ncbi:uncharacterized protein PITG_20990 [Phytophthora infestans T30-4]|uniref:Uncharacterized protein n=1 Tax=Phytophthora infestans (strain T30-4) TaxID=403677 RepID=D0P3C4_PHYIT|nr:uncharacterized protein PITG_20990 [Phytophthora infestans T30-4]EEY59312.1 conserved hypothetical protein [Phytophthora infestans T30-4]|eukprot:XP_002895207.1 conserved hypothetical protein [Phytophthora infestans T30-4]
MVEMEVAGVDRVANKRVEAEVEGFSVAEEEAQVLTELEAVVVGSSMFIFGGTAGGTGSELSDLYRLDYTPSVALGVAPTARWTQLASLTDRESPSIAERRVHAGRATLLTPFELMAVGRGLKSPRRASLGSRTAMAASRFESQLDVRLKRLEDLIDGWRTVATASGEDESALDEQRPVPRYWAASAFVSSLPGSKVPRVFLFGGQDDTTLLDDFWSLELAQLDEDFPQDRRKSQRIRASTNHWLAASAVCFSASFANLRRRPQAHRIAASGQVFIGSNSSAAPR